MFQSSTSKWIISTDIRKGFVNKVYSLIYRCAYWAIACNSLGRFEKPRLLGPACRSFLTFKRSESKPTTSSLVQDESWSKLTQLGTIMHKRFITSSRFSCIRIFLAPGTSKSSASAADHLFFNIRTSDWGQCWWRLLNLLTTPWSYVLSVGVAV